MAKNGPKNEPILRPRKATEANALKAAAYSASSSLLPGEIGSTRFRARWYAETWLYGSDLEEATAVLRELAARGELDIHNAGETYEAFSLPEEGKS